MQLSEAKQLKYGQQVRCPADRGEPAFIGTVRTPTEIIAELAVCKTIHGQEYIWIEVMEPCHHKAFWPSNRLERT